MNTARLVRRGIGAAMVAGAVTVLGLGTSTRAGASTPSARYGEPTASSGCVSKAGGPTRVGRIGGVLRPLPRTGCGARNAGSPAVGDPPLLFHGGAVMGTSTTGPVVVRPIFWHPSGHAMTTSYRNLISTYLRDVAAASSTHTNVFSTLTEYSGTNGSIRYKVKFGTAINDTRALPANGCTVAKNDKTNIYADKSGYDACLDNAQVITETDRLVTAQSLPRDYGHIYVMFLPKHVESCINAGSTTTPSNECTLNHQLSASYCAYHSQAGSGTVYANLPFPIYNSSTPYTCGSDAKFPAIQTPNGNPDADTEVSPTSHEIMEAITDPDVTTGWYDASGYENGDECAYVYGPTQGSAGQKYNQVINTRRYLTQEEFSNRDFATGGGGCLQSE